MMDRDSDQRSGMRKNTQGGKEQSSVQRGLFEPPRAASLRPVSQLIAQAARDQIPAAITPEIKVRAQKPEMADAIRDHYNFQEKLAPLILAARDYTLNAELEFRLNPSLSSLPDIREMKNGSFIISHLADCIIEKRPLMIATDFDNDGIVSNMIATDILKSVGFSNLHSVLPIRDETGYGLSEKFFWKQHAIMRERFGNRPMSLLTADFGTTNKKEILQAQKEGYWVGVLDHHHVGDVDCPAVLGNPGQTGCGFEDNVLAANGLMLLTMFAVHDELKRRGAVQESMSLKDYLVPAAIATIADCVPLRGASWTIAYHGLRMFEDSPFPVFQEMLSARGVRGTPSGSDLSMLIAPMINAAGRLGDANFMIEALADRQVLSARATAERLLSLNKTRQDIEAAMLQSALQSLPKEVENLPRFICLMDEAFEESDGILSGYHKGVVGIVSQRLVERYLRPVVLFANYDGEASGSFRTVDGYNLIANLDKLRKHFIKVGGHPAAAGGTIDASQFSKISELLNRSVELDLGAQYKPPSFHVDAVCTLRDINPTAVRELKRFEPFGTDNPEPDILIPDLFVEKMRVFGKHRNNLSVTLSDGHRTIEAVYWRRTDMPMLQHNNRVHIIGTPTLNASGETVQFSLKTALPADEGVGSSKGGRV